MLCHLLALTMFVGVPFGNLLGPLVMWLIKKEEFPLVDTEGKKALNFQISMTIYFIGAFILCFVLIGIPLLAALLVAELILVVIASVKTQNNEAFEYPLSIKFLR